VRALAVGVTKEASSPRREYRGIPGDGDTSDDFGLGDDDVGAAPAPSWPPRNRADDPSLHNPLLRLERMGCGWLGVIFEWEGVIVEDDTQLEKQAWLTLAEEEGKSPPLAFVLKRVEGMKTEHAIAEVLCWSRDPSELRRLASRKEEIHRALRGGVSYQMRDGSREFMSTLANYKIPLAVASTRPRKVIEESIEAVGARGFFAAVVAAEDVYRGKPDPELFLYAAQLLRFIPERCIVFGNSNSAVEAAHDAQMKCVAVASRHPVYELSAADLVVKQLNELSVVDLKNLAAVDDSAEFGAEPEMEEEDDAPPSTAVGIADDIFL
jgi:HAD superfamily hydrolase (TIGR01509 family)